VKSPCLHVHSFSYVIFAGSTAGQQTKSAPSSSVTSRPSHLELLGENQSEDRARAYLMRPSLTQPFNTYPELFQNSRGVRIHDGVFYSVGHDVHIGWSDWPRNISDSQLMS
jgi:hypothetical protein